MNTRSTKAPSTLFARALTRRRALTHTGAGLAALGGAIAGARPAAILAQEASPPADEPNPPGAPGHVTPEWAALAVAQLPDLAEATLQRSGVPGMSVAVVYDDELVFSGGFGVRDVGTKDAVDAETVFQLASVSKPLSATVVSAVVGDGAISWDTRLTHLAAPRFALHESWTTEHVTLADLFSHRSGLHDHAGDWLEDLGFDRTEILQRLQYLKPEYDFRMGYEYTNFGLTAAAVAVAESVGLSWEDLSEERLYAPLGMTRTSSLFADYRAEPNRAVPHVRDGAGWIVTPIQREPDAQSPAGGANSTANDMGRWLRLQLAAGAFDGDQVIPAAALAPMHRPQAMSNIPEDPATQRAGFYGLGMNVSYTDFGTVQWGHSGAFASGSATAVFLLPGSGFGVVVLTNGAPVGAAEAVGLSVLDIASTGAVTRDWYPLANARFLAAEEANYATATDWATPPTDPTAAAPDAAYLGTYRNDFYGDAEIARGADGLVLRIGPAPLEFPLTHYDRDTFSWQPVGENAAGRSGLSFQLDAAGVAVAFGDDYLAAGGPGVLTRSS